MKLSIDDHKIENTETRSAGAAPRRVACEPPIDAVEQKHEKCDDVFRVEVHLPVRRSTQTKPRTVPMAIEMMPTRTLELAHAFEKFEGGRRQTTSLTLRLRSSRFSTR